MQNNSKNVIVLAIIYLVACFFMESSLQYDVFHSPEYNLILKTILFLAAHSIFSYLSCDVFANELDRQKTIRNIILISFACWFLYKGPQLIGYLSRSRKIFNIVVILEWLEIVIVPFIVAKIYERRNGFFRKSKK